MLTRSALRLALALAFPLAAAVMPSTSSVALAAPTAAEAGKEAARVAVDARFQRHVLAPNGRIVGLGLADGSIVHLRSHREGGPEAALKAGDALHIEGVPVKTPTGAVITRAVVEKDGKVIADARKHHGHRGKGKDGKEHKGEHKGEHQPLAPVTAAGKITGLVSSPNGHLRALLLQDGTTAMGTNLEGLGLKVGDAVSLSGMGGAYPLGKALQINTIRLPSGETRTLPAPQRHHRKAPPEGTPA